MCLVQYTVLLQANVQYIVQYTVVFEYSVSVHSATESNEVHMYIAKRKPFLRIAILITVPTFWRCSNTKRVGVVGPSAQVHIYVRVYRWGKIEGWGMGQVCHYDLRCIRPQLPQLKILVCRCENGRYNNPVCCLPFLIPSCQR